MNFYLDFYCNRNNLLLEFFNLNVICSPYHNQDIYFLKHELKQTHLDILSMLTSVLYDAPAGKRIII